MKFITRLFILAIFCAALGVSTIFGFYLYLKPELPDVATLKDVELQTPMQIYSADGKLISQFGEKRRIPVSYNQIPQSLINALIATEDSRFYDHPGVDPIGITRAALVVALSGSAKQGASTITQQLARNFFLSNEKKVIRKIKEIFIALHIEQQLTKQEILELYVNKIFLGYRAYGFGAAAQVYFDKSLSQLTLSEIATLAGMPKAPSTMNPIYSIERATARRNVVLKRMLDEGYISDFEYEEAKNEPIIARYHGAEVELVAPYIAEMARAWAVDRYGEKVYESGLKIYTTIDSKMQHYAQKSAINNLLAYDMRHGYRGPVSTLWQAGQSPWTAEKIKQYLDNQPSYGDLAPAVVMQVQNNSADVYLANYQVAKIQWDGMKWARRFRSDTAQDKAPKSANDIIASGQQIWVRKVDNAWQLSQVPDANTAMVAMSPQTGAIKALIGGFNFTHSKFNRATQSIRQVGSIIKPFIYSAAIDKGLTLATLINDAPINEWDVSQGIAWRPKNSPAKYDGPLRARIGLAQSKNVMAVRVMRRVGLNDTIEFLTRFGFKRDNLPRSETIALGAGSLTPLELAQGFSVFANGGHFIQPFYINRVENPDGSLILQVKPQQICKENCPDTLARDSNNLKEEEDLLAASSWAYDNYAPRVISEQNAFLVREMMESNIWGGGNWRQGTGWNGTGWRAQKPLHRADIGGKTGTTNDVKDAWYTGYGPDLVTTVWVGFDNNVRSLGKTYRNPNLGEKQEFGVEAGARTAQPAWIDFMVDALNGVPQEPKQIPSDIVKVRIDNSTGLLSDKDDGSSMFEYFISGTEPTSYTPTNAEQGNIDASNEELF